MRLMLSATFLLPSSSSKAARYSAYLAESTPNTSRSALPATLRAEG